MIKNKACRTKGWLLESITGAAWFGTKNCWSNDTLFDRRVYHYHSRWAGRSEDRPWVFQYNGLETRDMTIEKAWVRFESNYRLHKR